LTINKNKESIVSSNFIPFLIMVLDCLDLLAKFLWYALVLPSKIKTVI